PDFRDPIEPIPRLSLVCATSRTVAAVDCCVAILALPSHRENTARSTGRPTVTSAVTLEAQPRTRELQRELIHRAVRIVAIQAVFAHWKVFKQKWPALLRMTGVADVVDRIFFQQCLGETAVRIMAVRANHLAFAQRHV